MTFEESKIYVHNNPQIFLKAAKKKGYICPLCNNGTGTSGDGLVTKNNVTFKCFKCGFYGDIISLIGELYSITDTKEKFKKTYDIYGISPKANTKSRVSAKGRLQTEPHTKESLKYLHSRGLTDQTIETYKIEYANTEIILNYDRNCPYYIARSITEKSFRKPKTVEYGEEPIFQESQLVNDEIIYVTESPFCALTILQQGGRAVALGGTGHTKLVRTILEKNIKPKGVILCLDNDTAGETASEKLKVELEVIGVPVICFNISGEYKDPNECFVNSPTELCENILTAEQHLRQYLESKVEDYRTSMNLHEALHKYEEYINNSKGAIPTGFQNLDKKLNGGLYPGLYILGAMSSIGKTTFLLQLAIQLAQAGEDILFFSLEMPKVQMVAKTLSTIAYSYNHKVTTREVMKGECYYSLPDNVISSLPTSLFIIDHSERVEPSFITDKAEEHIRITGKKPIVIVDYLQILRTADYRLSDKQQTDVAVFELKKLSTTYDLIVVAISSFNRDSYTAPVTLRSFKESGAIEYTNDVLLGLQYKDMKEDRTTDAEIEKLKAAKTREITLKILKNRNGESSTKVDYEYYPAYNYFKELKTTNKQQNEMKVVTI